MKLNFNLEDINYLKVSYKKDNTVETVKMGLKEKTENKIIAIARNLDITGICAPQSVSIGFVCNDGLYTTTTELSEIYHDEEFTYIEMLNPKSLDYQQNREYYRVLAEYDCIYTVYGDYENESYSAVTYDISAGGVSIILPENAISKEECSLVIMFPDGDLKSHLKFMRCEAMDDNYKLSFEFTDLSERDYNRLQQMCVNKQIY